MESDQWFIVLRVSLMLKQIQKQTKTHLIHYIRCGHWLNLIAISFLYIDRQILETLQKREMGKTLVVRISALRFRQATQVQILARRSRGGLQGFSTWKGPWSCWVARAGAWTEDETLTADSSFATKQPQRDNDSQQKQSEWVRHGEKEREWGKQWEKEEDKVNMKLWMKKMHKRKKKSMET